MKKKKDFVMREVTYSNDMGNVEVTRTRTSSGYCSISVKVDEQLLSFRNDKDENYEFTARDLSDLLDEAANDQCSLEVK